MIGIRGDLINMLSNLLEENGVAGISTLLLGAVLSYARVLVRISSLRSKRTKVVH